MDIRFDQEIADHLQVLRKLERPSGAFVAADSDIYNKSWLRDIYFVTLGFLETGDIDTVARAARVLLDVFLKHKDKINWAIENKPHETWQYIHARFHPDTFEEYWEEWGNRQNDAVGEVLNIITDLELRGAGIVKTEEEKEMVQKIVDYLVNVEYWNDPDNGIWEEWVELHASSVGAVVAALKKAAEVPWITVPDAAIQRGEESLRSLLPRESRDKFTDLALLTLIYPFRVTTPKETEAILRNVEYHLIRDLGVIRYKNDRYFNANRDGFSEEAEWCMGLSWLAIIYAEQGDSVKAMDYLARARKTVTPEGKIPELYFSHTDKPNENTPLAWAESMYVVALKKVKELPR